MRKKGLRLKKLPIVKHFGTGLLLGAVSGAITGIVITLYKFCAKKIIHLSEEGYGFLRENPLWLIPVAIGLLGVAWLFSFIYHRVTNLRGGGIPTAIGLLRGWLPFRWVRNVVGIFGLSLTTFLIGVPLGNEGPSVQLGTALGKGCSALWGRRGEAWSRYSMTGGACAGFSTATGAPVSGILFAVEEAHHRVSPLILLVATAAVSAARLVSDLLAPVLGVSSNLFPNLELQPMLGFNCWIPLVLGGIFGLFAVVFLSFYRYMTDLLNHKLAKVADVYKIYVVMLLTVGMGLISFSYVSTGHELVLALFDGETVWMLLLLLLVRSVLTMGANGTNITGGIFLPILAIGATLSALFGKCIIALGVDAALYPTILVLGITACIAGMMKMPLTAVAFAVEALSGHQIMLPVLLVTAVSYGVAELFGAVSINDRVLDNRMEQVRKGRKRTTAEATVVVQPDSFAEGKEIRDILWPDGLFVLAVDKSRAMGEKTLHNGDRLHVRYSTFHEERLHTELTAIVGVQQPE